MEQSAQTCGRLPARTETLATLGKLTLYTNVVWAVLDTAQHTFQLHYNMVEHLKNVISCFKWVSSTQAVYVRLLD